MSDYDEPDITITTEIEFGDADPEDAYDAGDPDDERLTVLEAVVEHLGQNRDDRFEARRQETLRVINDFIEEHARRQDRRQDRVDRAEEIRDALEGMD